MIKELFKKNKNMTPQLYAKNRFSDFSDGIEMCKHNHMIYDEMKRAIPIIDACIQKIIRLVGDFEVRCCDLECQKVIDKFLKEVTVGASSTGIKQFIGCYLEQMLVYGNGIGEMVLNDDNDGIGYLYNVKVNDVLIKEGRTPFELEFYKNNEFSADKISCPEYILFSPLNPKGGEITGTSILSGLEFVTSILTKIYKSIGKNFDRVGDVRFAVTYNPVNDIDSDTAKEIVKDMSQRWSEVMSKSFDGSVNDFMSVGDVDIKVIGADNQILDIKEPIRTLLEQIVAKLGIPPFMLGIQWSSTERMSTQQADILTSELKNYRKLLSPVIEKICRTHLALKGLYSDMEVNWQNISLQDEVEIAKAKLLNAQAKKVDIREENLC